MAFIRITKSLVFFVYWRFINLIPKLFFNSAFFIYRRLYNFSFILNIFISNNTVLGDKCFK